MKARCTSVAAELALLSFLVHASACRRSTPVTPSDGRVAEGAWGGPHVALTVASAGAHLEFDCASGDIARPVDVDVQGRFTADGVYVREHPGPIAIGADPVRLPARYSGRVDGAAMTLDVLLTGSNETIGPFTLTYGAFARVNKCL